MNSSRISKVNTSRTEKQRRTTVVVGPIESGIGYNPADRMATFQIRTKDHLYTVEIPIWNVVQLANFALGCFIDEVKPSPRSLPRKQR